jgi:hypothetical protein
MNFRRRTLAELPDSRRRTLAGEQAISGGAWTRNGSPSRTTISNLRYSDRSAASDAAVEIAFQTLNRYVGVAVGEHLGYLFTGL